MAFAGAALLGLEDVDGDRALTAISLRHRGDADIGVGCQLLERGFDHCGQAHVVGHHDFEIFSFARLHLEILAVDLLDGAADSYRFLLRVADRCRHHRNGRDGAKRSR